MKAPKKKSSGIYYISPDGKLKIQRICDGFVDDTTVWVNDFLQEISLHTVGPLAPIYNALHTTAQWWEQLLNATGGKLELSKCFYYVLQWGFDSQGRSHLNDLTALPNIGIIQHEDDNLYAIDHKPHSQGHHTLEVCLSPNDSDKLELSHLLEKSRAYAI